MDKMFQTLRSYPRFAEGSWEALRKLQPPTSTFKFPDDSSYVGIEVEVEKVRDWPPLYVWMDHVDGSLRDNGREFVSVPVHGNQIEEALCWLITNLPKSASFSKRCSIHIHLNIRDMTPDQVLGLIITYLAVEYLLFQFEGNGREKSIFCVPLGECSLIEHLLYMKDNNFLTDNWTKYSALNLLPIGDKGSVEFRHMEGTNDIQRIMGWIALIQRIRLYAKKYTSDQILSTVTSLNTNSMYKIFVLDVFREDAKFIDVSNAQKLMESNVTMVKTNLINNPYHIQMVKKAMGAKNSLLSKKMKELLSQNKIKEYSLDDILESPPQEFIPTPQIRRRIDQRINEPPLQISAINNEEPENPEEDERFFIFRTENGFEFDIYEFETQNRLMSRLIQSGLNEMDVTQNFHRIMEMYHNQFHMEMEF